MDTYTPGTAKYTWPKEIKSRYGELPETWADEARLYIRTLCRVYPFQMRFFLGEPMWMRFCEAWAMHGDFKWAMRQI